MGFAKQRTALPKPLAAGGRSMGGLLMRVIVERPVKAWGSLLRGVHIEAGTVRGNCGE